MRAAKLIRLILLKGRQRRQKYKQAPGGPTESRRPPRRVQETEAEVREAKDDVIRGKWWEMFDEAQLNALEERVEISNQNIALAEANFRSARALVKEARSQLYPTVTTNPSIINSRQTSRQSQSAVSPKGAVKTTRRSTSWEPDFWHALNPVGKTPGKATRPTRKPR